MTFVWQRAGPDDESYLQDRKSPGHRELTCGHSAESRRWGKLRE